MSYSLVKYRDDRYEPTWICDNCGTTVENGNSHHKPYKWMKVLQKGDLPPLHFCLDCKPKTGRMTE